MVKKRLKLLLKILLTSIVLLFVFLLFERVRGQISLARYKRELASKGETLDVHKLIAPPVSDADNGAPEVLQLKALLRDGKALPDDYPPRMKLIGPGKAMVGFREASWVDGWGSAKVTNSWEDVALDLGTNRQAFEQLRVAVAKPSFDFKLDHSRGFEMSVVHLIPVKSLAQLSGASVQNSLRNRENQAALDSLLVTLGIPGILENDRIAISELVRVAISSINLATTWEALQADVWTDEQLTLIQRAWEKNTFATNMVRSLKVERADADTYFERFKKSNDETYKYMFPTWMADLTGGDGSDGSHWWQQEFVRKQIYCQIWRFAWLYQDEQFYLEGMQQLIDDHRTGAAQAAQEGKSTWFGIPTAKIPPSNFYDDWRFGMSAKSLASLSLVMLRSARAETERSMVLSAIALKRYSLRHGKPAPDLNALVPEFLSVVPMDYMDGKPMKYRLDADGTWLLYSAGEDGSDEGGDPSPAKSDQTSLWMWRGKDAVWPSPATSEEIEAWRKKPTKN